MTTRRAIGRAIAAIAITTAVTLAAAGSAPAATRWLCGPASRTTRAGRA
jgi:hypothetical protein